MIPIVNVMIRNKTITVRGRGRGREKYRTLIIHVSVFRKIFHEYIFAVVHDNMLYCTFIVHAQWGPRIIYYSIILSRRGIEEEKKKESPERCPARPSSFVATEFSCVQRQ